MPRLQVAVRLRDSRLRRRRLQASAFSLLRCSLACSCSSHGLSGRLSPIRRACAAVLLAVAPVYANQLSCTTCCLHQQHPVLNRVPDAGGLCCLRLVAA